MRESWIIVLLVASLACAPEPPNEEMFESARALLVAGEFARAEEAYERIVEMDAADPEALVALGTLALYGNRFEEAEDFLSRATRVAQDPSEALRALAECHYRQDDFENAARLARQAGEELRAAQLNSFAGQTPNRVVAEVEMTRLPFVATDPLPLVRLSVNGSESLFLIDTGGGELILSAAFAQLVGAEIVGSSEGLFAGGQRLETQSGRVSSVGLGAFELRDVPVNVNPGIEGVAGILGTIPLYHFFATLDYVNGALVLRRKRSGAGGRCRGRAVRHRRADARRRPRSRSERPVRPVSAAARTHAGLPRQRAHLPHVLPRLLGDPRPRTHAPALAAARLLRRLTQ